MNQSSNDFESGFNHLPYQWDEYSEMWRYEEFHLRWAQYRGKPLPENEQELIKKSIYQNIDATLEIMEQAVMNDPLKYYVPTGDNVKIIEALNNCRKGGNIVATIANFAGNGTGKTETLVNIILNVMIPHYNDYWFGGYDFFVDPKLKHPNIWYCSSSEALKRGEAVDSTLHKYLDPIGYGGYIKYKSGNILASLKLPDSNYTITFKTYGQDKTAFESGNVAIIIHDEPSSTILYNASKGRARGGLIMLMNFTPLECPQEMLQDIEDGVKDPTQVVYKFTSSLWGTSKTKGERGFYTDDEIDEIVAKYAPEERDARVSGTPLYYIGMVYKNFKESKHVQVIEDEDFESHTSGNDLWYMPHKDAVYLYSEDPADAKPQMGLWTAVNPNGRIIHMAEVPNHDGRPYWKMKFGVSVDQHFNNIIRIEDMLGEKLGLEKSLPVVRRILDYHFGSQQRGGQDNLFYKYVKESRERGLKGRWVDSYKSRIGKSEIKYGHSVVMNNLESYLSDGHPKVVFWSTCPHHIQSMLTYSYRVKLGEGMAFGNNVIEEGKDGADVVRYVHCDKLIDYKKQDDDVDYTNSNEITDYTSLV